MAETTLAPLFSGRAATIVLFEYGYGYGYGCTADTADTASFLVSFIVRGRRLDIFAKYFALF